MRWDKRALGLGPRALVLLVFLGCGDSRSAGRTASTDTLDATDHIPRDAMDSALNTPRLITERTVVLFWVHAGDSLNPEDQASALEDLNYYTEQISPALKAYGIALVPTNSDTVYLALPNRQRRPILLTGLEYPFGYLLLDPEGVERILSGVYADDELLDEIRAYFDLPDDTAKVQPRITT